MQVAGEGHSPVRVQPTSGPSRLFSVDMWLGSGPLGSGPLNSDQSIVGSNTLDVWLVLPFLPLIMQASDSVSTQSLLMDITVKMKTGTYTCTSSVLAQY